MDRFKQGAFLTAEGVQFTTWAPTCARVSVQILKDREEVAREVELEKKGGGYFSGIDPQAVAGTLYKYKLGDDLFPDVASRFQPFGVHGPSEVCDEKFEWKQATARLSPPQEWIIYELHVGTFTPEGTFLSVIGKLKWLKDLGITAIEIMPVGDFAGERNWGYDGVLPFAPARCYGRPEDLKSLVDAAHGYGISVLLDVIYNHLGPSGNYFQNFSPYYFTEKHRSFWGKGLNFDDVESRAVRDYFIDNAKYWAEDFHIDGVRLDSTHSIIDHSAKHILNEMAECLHQHGVHIIAEDERNMANLFTDKRHLRHGFDGVWADDFHHTIRVALTGERHSHFGSFNGTAAELADLLDHGWLYRGSHYPHWKRARGSPCKHLEPSSFIHCISNHDQAGNRPHGERLNHLIGADAYRSMSALLCLSPFTPMFFMGQEWAASTPFLFFTDHEPEVGRKIAPGRKEEFRKYGCNYPLEVLESMPNPQEWSTFEGSRLNWAELDKPEHAACLELHRECLRLRKLNTSKNHHSRDKWKVFCIANRAVAILFGTDGMDQQLVVATVWAPLRVSLRDIGFSKAPGRWKI
ncbi:MAG: malto-oligosyltrehalose trehalohydrolase, partial [Verrucomicrobiales bacterium]|nr:malto-oligosyltrehalose trehalohydrolase [Verrucomicrobiales bacterium]